MKADKPKLTKEQLRKVLEHLNTFYPTRGDGVWGEEFIQQVYQGKHLGVPNAKLVREALRVGL